MLLKLRWRKLLKVAAFVIFPTSITVLFEIHQRFKGQFFNEWPVSFKNSFFIEHLRWLLLFFSYFCCAASWTLYLHHYGYYEVVHKFPILRKVFIRASRLYKFVVQNISALNLVESESHKSCSGFKKHFTMYNYWNVHPELVLPSIIRQEDILNKLFLADIGRSTLVGQRPMKSLSSVCLSVCPPVTTFS